MKRSISRPSIRAGMSCAGHDRLQASSKARLPNVAGGFPSGSSSSVGRARRCLSLPPFASRYGLRATFPTRRARQWPFPQWLLPSPPGPPTIKCLSLRNCWGSCGVIHDHIHDQSYGTYTQAGSPAHRLAAIRDLSLGSCHRCRLCPLARLAPTSSATGALPAWPIRPLASDTRPRSPGTRDHGQVPAQARGGLARGLSQASGRRPGNGE